MPTESSKRKIKTVKKHVLRVISVCAMIRHVDRQRCIIAEMQNNDFWKIIAESSSQLHI